MNEQIFIRTDDDFAKTIGFTSDLFVGYLTLTGNCIWVSFILSKEPNQGNFRSMVQRILSMGFVVKVPNPLPVMRSILVRNKYKRKKCYDKLSKEYIEYWEKRPK